MSDSRPFSPRIPSVILSKIRIPTIMKTKCLFSQEVFYNYVHFNVVLNINGSSYFRDLASHKADRQVTSGTCLTG
jgi:hypothetical protein